MEKNNLDWILLDIMIHIHPKYLKEGHPKDKISTQNFDKKKLNEYLQLLTSLDFAYKKVMRYELYFSKFYPETNEINKFEALEHHMHAYLEDIDILKNKIILFFGTLKNDLKKIATNKKEINEAFTVHIKNMQEVFKNASDNRNPHHHKGMKFIDGNLIDSSMAHTMLQRNNPLRDSFKPEFLEELKKQEVESFEKAKMEWITIAQNNNIQMTGFINEAFEINKEYIYTFLNIKPIAKDAIDLTD